MFSEIIAGDWLSQAALSWLPILLDAAIKGAIVLGVAGMIVLFMRRASAAARHLVWTLGLGSLLLLPVLSAALPAWQVLPPWLNWGQPAAQADAAGMSPASTSSPAQPGIAFPPDRRESLAGGRAWAAPAIAGAAARGPAPVARGPADEAEVGRSEHTASAGSGDPRRTEVVLAAVGIWLAGAAWALLPAGIALWSLWRLGRRSHRIHGGPWRAAVNRLCAELGLRRRVLVLCSPSRRMPMVWGVFRPKLLIPAGAGAWSADRLRAVLLHELAHVQRHDCFVYWIAQIARAVHWFNPLAWIASRRAALESERACDDAVLTHGFRAPDYAQHLLEIASGYRARPLEARAAIAMARSSRLETRFVAILDAGRTRRGVTRVRVLLSAAVAMGVILSLAILQPAGRSSSEVVQAGEAARTELEARAILPAARPPGIAWGTPVKGLELGLQLATPRRSYRLGQSVDFTVYARNVGSTAVDLVDFVGVNPPRDDLPLHGWAPTVRDAAGKKLLLAIPPSDRPVLERKRTLEPGKTMVVGTVTLRVSPTDGPSDPPPVPVVENDPSVHVIPGAYRVAQTYRFEDRPGATWSGELTSGEVVLQVIDAAVPLESFRGLDLTDAPRSRDAAALADLWEERPPGSKSYEIRKEAVLTHHGLDGRVYYLPAKKVFYVQHDPPLSSQLTFYGPFAGDPREVIKPDTEAKTSPKAAESRASTPQPSVAWGTAVRGLELGLQLTNPRRSYRLGDSFEFTVHARNVGPKPLVLADYATVNPPRDDLPLHGWAPTVRDAAGKQMPVNIPPFGAPVWERKRTLEPGKTMVVGTVTLRVSPTEGPSDPPPVPVVENDPSVNVIPGTYRVSQTYRFADRPGATWSGELTSGEVTLEVVAAGGPLESFRGLDLTDVPRSRDWAALPDLWEERPPGSKSYEIRKDVVVTDHGVDGTVYYLPAKKVFYVQHDPAGSSQLTYYGPFAGDPRQVLKPDAEAKTAPKAAPAKTAKKPAPPPTAAAQGWVEFSGRVVDDETGRPVEQFALQTGWPDPTNPSRIGWGGMTTSSSPRRGGRFSERMGSPVGKKIGLRILADGYMPQPVVPEIVVEAPATRIDLVVRLKRGGEARGRVFDHAGKPVANATVYLSGNEILDLMDFRPQHFSGSRATTDAQGRFSLSGAGGAQGRLVIASALLAVWTAPVPEPGTEATIKLPEPAMLKVRSDIKGAGGQVRLHLHLKTWEMEGWKQFVDARKYLDAPNPGDATFGGLTPGTYDLSRTKELRVGDLGKGVFLDRRTITLESAKTTLAEFVRKGGHPITGQLTGLQHTNVAGAFIFVKDGKASGDPRKSDDAKLPMFDADICAVDGQFKTETLAPGQYTVAAEAYKPEDRTGSMRTGWRLPDYLGTAKVTVRAEGPPPQVRIEMRPYKRIP